MRENHYSDHTEVVALTPIGYVERDGKDKGPSADELRMRPARVLLDLALTDGLMGLEPRSVR